MSDFTSFDFDCANASNVSVANRCYQLIRLRGELMYEDKKHILSLPLELLRYIFFQMCSFDDIVGFDSAVLNKKYRRAFLDFLASNASSFLMSSDLIVDSREKMSYLICRKLICKREQLTVKFRGFRETDIVHLTQTCSVLKEICLRNCIHVTDIGLSILANKCRGIRSIDLSLTHIADEGLMTLADSCPGILSINLSSTYITNTGLMRLAQKCPGIQSIELSRCHHITDDGLSVFAQGCPGIQHIDLSFCFLITNVGLARLAQGCPGIQHIDLSLLPITDDGLSVLTRGCLGIQSMNLSYCYRITDFGLSVLARSCPAIQSINFSYCFSITDDGVTSLAQGCRNIESLNLSHCCKVTDVGLANLSRECKVDIASE